MSMTEAELTLREFIQSHARQGVLVDEILAATLDAFERADRPQPPRAELAEKAKTLVKAATDFERTLNDCADLGFYLRNSKTLSQGKTWDQISNQEANQFDASFRRLSGEVQTIRTAALRLIDISAPSSVLVRKGKPIDETRLMLGHELVLLYVFTTDKAPTVTGEATLDAPNTDFGRFVALASACRPYGVQLAVGFSSFLRKARSGFMAELLLTIFFLMIIGSALKPSK